jgi:hypothetical protein
MGADDRGEPAERTQITYFCAQGHQSRPIFSVQAQIPETWECPRCSQPAGRDRDNPPSAGMVAPYRTHLAYVRERRSDADAERLLNEALAKLRGVPIPAQAVRPTPPVAAPAQADPAA